MSSGLAWLLRSVHQTDIPLPCIIWFSVQMCRGASHVYCSRCLICWRTHSQQASVGLVFTLVCMLQAWGVNVIGMASYHANGRVFGVPMLF